MDGSTFWMYQQDEVRKPLQKSDKLRSLFFKGQGVYIPLVNEYGIVIDVGDNALLVKTRNATYKPGFAEVEIALVDAEGRNGN